MTGRDSDGQGAADPAELSRRHLAIGVVATGTVAVILGILGVVTAVLVVRAVQSEGVGPEAAIAVGGVLLLAVITLKIAIRCWQLYRELTDRVTGPLHSVVTGGPLYRGTHIGSTSMRGGSTLRLLALLLANAVPLAGVLLLDWSLHSVLLIYWMETGVVILLTLPKYVLVWRVTDPAPDASAGNFWQAIGLSDALFRFVMQVRLIVVHLGFWGLWWVGIGVFLLNLSTFVPSIEFGPILPSAILSGTAGFALKRILSFKSDFYDHEGYRAVDTDRLFLGPAPGLGILASTFFVGVILAGFLGAALPVIVVLVVLKTALDFAAFAYSQDLGGSDRNDGRTDTEGGSG